MKHLPEPSAELIKGVTQQQLTDKKASEYTSILVMYRDDKGVDRYRDIYSPDFAKGFPLADAADFANGAHYVPGDVTEARRQGHTVKFDPDLHQWTFEIQIQIPIIKSMFQVYETVLHKKSNSVYMIICGPDKTRLEATNTPAYAYRKDDEPEGIIWVRSQEEMEDGRFESISRSNSTKHST